MRWNHMYGMFSRAFFDQDFNGWTNLLVWPPDLNNDPDMMFASAFWLYMTPQFPLVSAHDIMTGFFEPNNIDLNYDLGSEFGTTTIVISQD